jgi:electron transfer flavoprotein alpha subunit
MLLVLVEHAGGKPSDASLQALTLARSFDAAAPMIALLAGPGAREAAEQLGPHGVGTAYVTDDDAAGGFAPDAWAASLEALADQVGSSAVFAAGTDRGNEVMARLAARSGLPLAANCVAIHPGRPATLTRQRWGGSLLEEARLHSDRPLVTVAPHAVPIETAMASAQVDVKPFHPSLDAKDFVVRVVEHLDAPGGGVSLAEAKVVVSGGRGVGSKEGFAIIEELAGLLGGAVGCSRVVTSAGWRPHTDQVGQTGTKIAPDLYIACGISGATQHMAGCKGAKRILAINSDAEAPIMLNCDFAVVGDLKEIVPAISAEIRKLK